MNDRLLSPEVHLFITDLTAAYPYISSIWLIGSRANGTARTDSDWDLLAFANRDVLESLKSDLRFNNDRVDLLVVSDDNNFASPRGSTPKHGNLTEWEWRELTNDKATYMATKPKYDQNGNQLFNVAISKGTALRIYP